MGSSSENEKQTSAVEETQPANSEKQEETPSVEQHLREKRFSYMSFDDGIKKSIALPPGVKNWNWGAFFIGAALCLLVIIIPYIAIVLPVLFGAKFNFWMWVGKPWDSVEQYQKAVSNWGGRVMGFVVFGALAVGALIALNIVRRYLPGIMPGF